MARKPRSRLVLPLLALVVAGCATLPPRQPPAEDARRALARLAAGWATFSDLRALAEVTVRRGEDRQRLTGVLLVKRPASVRFEALSPFGQPVLLVTVHDGRLTAWDLQQNEVLTGPATAQSIGRTLGLPLDPEDLVAVLAGRAAPPRDLRVAAVLPPDEHGTSLEVVDGDRRRRIWLDPASGAVRRMSMDGGRIELVVTYRWRQGAPWGFDLVAEPLGVTGSVAYRDVVLDGGIDPDRFVLTPPKGAKTRELR